MTRSPRRTGRTRDTSGDGVKGRTETRRGRVSVGVEEGSVRDTEPHVGGGTEEWRRSWGRVDDGPVEGRGVACVVHSSGEWVSWVDPECRRPSVGGRWGDRWSGTDGQDETEGRPTNTCGVRVGVVGVASHRSGRGRSTPLSDPGTVGPTVGVVGSKSRSRAELTKTVTRGVGIVLGVWLSTSSNLISRHGLRLALNRITPVA